MSAVNDSELSGLMSSVANNEFNCRLKDAVELTANECNSVVEPALAVDVVCDWLISEARLVWVRMDTVDASLSDDSMVDDELMYSELEVSIDDMYIDIDAVSKSPLSLA